VTRRDPLPEPGLLNLRGPCVVGYVSVDSRYAVPIHCCKQWLFPARPHFRLSVSGVWTAGGIFGDRRLTELNMRHADIISKLEDIRLDASSLEKEIGRDDLISSQNYYTKEIVRKINNLLTELQMEGSSPK